MLFLGAMRLVAVAAIAEWSIFLETQSIERGLSLGVGWGGGVNLKIEREFFG